MTHFDPILFDLDGTLIDSSRDIAAAVNRTLESLNRDPLSYSQITSFVGDGVRKLMTRVLADQNQAALDGAIRQFKKNYRAHCLDATVAYAGIPELLADLAPARLAVVTNKPVEFARQILRGLDLEQRMDTVVGGDETRLKPGPEPILLALERLGLKDGEGRTGIMIGDHQNDVQAGRSAGLATCGVGWGFDGGSGLAGSQPDYSCQTVDQLRDLLKK